MSPLRFALALGLLLAPALARADAGDASGGDATLGDAATDAVDASADATDGGSSDADALPPPKPTTGVVVAKPCSESDRRCQRGAFTVSKTQKVAGDFDFDTGWIPKDAAVQVRLLAYFHGRTRVDMSGTIDATWPDPIRLRPEGVKGTGLLAIDDGVVVKAQGRFKVKVNGKDYAWSGDLPGIPGVDLASMSHVAFDPWAWKGAGAPPKTSGKTKQIELAKVPITDSFIPIPGIEGGFQLEGQAELGATYVSLRIAFDEIVAKGAVADVDPTKPFTRVLFSSAPSLDSTLFVHGELSRRTTLHFIPGFYFEIFGKKFELELLDVPVALPESTKPWSFDPVQVHFPLPQLEAKPNPIDLGDVPIGTPTSVLVTLFDTGEAKLFVDASDPKGVLAIETKTLAIEGGNSDSLRATLTPTEAGPIETKIVLLSNDPAAPRVEVKVKANATSTAPSSEDPGTEAAGSCGCRTTASGDAPFFALPLASLLVAMRRARRRRGRAA